MGFLAHFIPSPLQKDTEEPTAFPNSLLFIFLDHNFKQKITLKHFPHKSFLRLLYMRKLNLTGSTNSNFFFS